MHSTRNTTAPSGRHKFTQDIARTRATVLDDLQLVIAQDARRSIGDLVAEGWERAEAIELVRAGWIGVIDAGLALVAA